MHGGHICVAGVDLETRRHVRPMLANDPLPFYLLARYGGPFEMARIVDLGSPRPRPIRRTSKTTSSCRPGRRSSVPPRPTSSGTCWRNSPARSLRTIFGEGLREVGRRRWATELGQGAASLGFCGRATPPELYLATARDGRPQVRMRFSDGQIQADAGVTDLRLFGDDHATPEAARIRAVAQWIADSQGVILGVGLTRKFRSSDDAAYRHWLQVNNIHLKEDPIWQLG